MLPERSITSAAAAVLHRVVVVVRKDPEPSGLALDTALSILEPVRGLGFLADALPSDEKFIWTVTDACNPDRGMNLEYGGHRVPPPLVCKSAMTHYVRRAGFFSVTGNFSP
jgi:hypothetical protein